jgi:hypothetical protein
MIQAEEKFHDKLNRRRTAGAARRLCAAGLIKFFVLVSTVAPILAGVDKFLHLLVNWDQYLAPMANKILGGHGHEVMLVVGVIEIHRRSRCRLETALVRLCGRGLAAPDYSQPARAPGLF